MERFFRDPRVLRFFGDRKMVVRAEFGFLVSENCPSALENELLVSFFSMYARKSVFTERFFRNPRVLRFFGDQKTVVRAEFGFLVSENCPSVRKTNFWSRFFRCTRGNRFSRNDFSVIRAY